MTPSQQKGDRNEVGNRQALGVTIAFSPTAASIAPLSRCGGGCGVISTWTFRRPASR